MRLLWRGSPRVLGRDWGAIIGLLGGRERGSLQPPLSPEREQSHLFPVLQTQASAAGTVGHSDGQGGPVFPGGGRLKCARAAPTPTASLPLHCHFPAAAVLPAHRCSGDHPVSRGVWHYRVCEPKPKPLCAPRRTITGTAWALAPGGAFKPGAAAPQRGSSPEKMVFLRGGWRSPLPPARGHSGAVAASGHGD